MTRPVEPDDHRRRQADLERRMIALERAPSALAGGGEHWTEATFPTTDLFVGRRIFMDSAIGANWNTFPYYWNGFYWRFASSRSYSHVITAGNITSTAGGVTTVGVQLGATPAGLEISTVIEIAGNMEQVQSGEYTRWQIARGGTALRQGVKHLAHHVDPVPFYTEHEKLRAWETNLAPGTTVNYDYVFQDDSGTALWIGDDTYKEAWNMIVTVS